MNFRFILLTGAASVLVFAAVLLAGNGPATAPVATPAASGIYYADCDAVRAAGKAPLKASQPGYRTGLDGNMNGVACEPIGVPTPAAMPATTATQETPINTSPEDAPTFSTAPSIPSGLTGQSTDTPTRDALQRQM